jgi:hypothetical protein
MIEHRATTSKGFVAPRSNYTGSGWHRAVPGERFSAMEELWRSLLGCQIVLFEQVSPTVYAERISANLR